MEVFRRELQARLSGRKKRRTWVFIPYDQLTSAVGPLSKEDPSELGIVFVVNPWKAERRPYHKQKLALIVSNMRFFALEQAERGVAIRYFACNGPYRKALEEAVRELGPLHVMRPAERELRQDLAPLIASGGVLETAHEGWLTTPDVLTASHPKGPPFLLERFYRLARQRYGVLMDGKEPVGGRFNFDEENRHPWKQGDPEPPRELRFGCDAVKQEAVDFVERQHARHPGRIDADTLPATYADAQQLWAWAKAHCLPHFGRYEDAMHTHSSSLFHTQISAVLNISRLLPWQVVREAEQLDIPVASKEGFIRQILGWREFMHHIHEWTDGFRRVPAGTPVSSQAGDGGYAHWSGHPWRTGKPMEPQDGAAMPSFLGADTPLPPLYWGRTSGMNCLDRIVEDVWRDGWSHHITRLMVLSNFATLLDVSPRELTDWFWIAYIDAYDWVVEPNVLGLGTFAVGPLFTTKPYISGGNYIHRMSNYCEGCRFDPKKNCPFSSLYWAFLERHRSELERNPRLSNMYRSARGRMGAASEQERFLQIREALLQGEKLEPEGQMQLR